MGNSNIISTPVSVCAFDSPNGCILAASVEAKRLGIKMGMRVMEGREINPNLIVLTPDPRKYRSVHLKLKKLLSVYSVLDFYNSDHDFYWYQRLRGYEVDDVEKKDNLTDAIDQINERWGEFVVKPAVILKSKQSILDRIAFGSLN